MWLSNIAEASIVSRLKNQLNSQVRFSTEMFRKGKAHALTSGVIREYPSCEAINHTLGMQMRLDQVEMLIAAGQTSARQIRYSLEEIHQALQTSGATRLLTGIDVCYTQIGASVVGIFSLYESRLQSAYGWGKPLAEVQKLLVKFGEPDQAEHFENFRLAVNVLKHGKGDSHSKLIARADRLPFKVQNTFGDLHEEGEMCPPSDLIVVSAEFLELCCDAIEKSWAIVQDVMLESAEQEPMVIVDVSAHEAVEGS